jgi:hypothetical protein
MQLNFFSEFIFIYSYGCANYDKFHNFSHNLKYSYKLNDVLLIKFKIFSDISNKL